MGLKSIIKKVVAKEAVGGILPMDGTQPKFGKKTKIAGVLGVIAAIAGALSQYLGG
jgi:hypothetical protein